MIDVRKLAMLREVALRGGITGAARSLGVSASGVSQQITRLETQYGVTLLEAEGRGVRLTRAAERLVGQAERVLALLEEAEGELIASKGVVEGVVQLGAFHTFATGFLAATTRHLERIAPGLTVRFTQIDSDEALEQVLARRVDIVVADEYPGYPISPVPGLVRSELGQEPILAYPPGGAAADPRTVAWAMEPGGTDAHRCARAACRSAGFEPKVQFESPDPYVHRRLVEQGIAAALLPVTVADGLRPWDSSEAGLPERLFRTLLTFVRRGSERAPAVRACRTAIELAVGDQPGVRSNRPPTGEQTHTVQSP